MSTGEIRDTSKWYQKEIGARLGPVIREVYRKWARIENDEELMNHLHTVRDKAWPFGEYPCVGVWIWLLPSISAFPQFPKLVETLQQKSADGNDPVIADLGCCFGQDLRLLASNGISTKNMLGTDMSSELWKLGYELFRDRDKMQADFFEANFVAGMPERIKNADPEADHVIEKKEALGADLGPLEHLKGRTDVLIANQFIHLFSLPVQTYVCTKIVKMSHVGTVLVGYQQSRARARAYSMPWGPMFYQTEATWRKMWKEVEELTDTEWQIEAREVKLNDWGMQEEDFSWMPADRQGINFFCTRVR